MYIFGNALKNLWRNRSRNLLIGAITLVIIITTVISLTVNNTAAKIIEDTRYEYGTKVDIVADIRARYQMGNQFTPLSIQQYIEFGKSELLSAAVFSGEIPAYSETVTAKGDESRNTGTYTGSDGKNYPIPTMKIMGDSNVDQLPDFGNGRKLIQGKMYAGLNECIISEDLAKLNGLSVGDTITLQTISPPIFDYHLTIVGIYSDKTEEYSIPYPMAYLNRRNEVLTSFDTLTAGEYASDTGISINATYYLKSPDLLSKFQAEVKAKGLPNGYTININEAAFNKVVTPLEGMKGVFLTFMIWVLILGGITLALLSFLAIRERKYEIGVLRVMGMEKHKVSLGLLSEAMTITLLCLLIGIVAGNIIAQPIASNILDNQVAAAKQANAANDNKMLMSGGQTQLGSDGTGGVVPISEIQVSLGTDTLVQIAGIALALAILSGVMGISQIMKYEPMKILRERG
jgi:putative ABC transport system permease protein